MKTLLGLIFFAGLGFSTSSFAQYQTPQMVCNYFQAPTTHVQVAWPAGMIVGFCNFGHALIEAGTLRWAAGNPHSTLITRAYLHNHHGRTCQSMGGVVRVGTLLPHYGQIAYCQFADNSVMELSTFNRGPRHPLNRHLNHILWIR